MCVHRREGGARCSKGFGALPKACFVRRNFWGVLNIHYVYSNIRVAEFQGGGTLVGGLPVDSLVVGGRAGVWGPLQGHREI